MNVQLLLIFHLRFFFFFPPLWLCHWCCAAEISHFSTPAHKLTVERIRPRSLYSCCGEIQAWIYPRDQMESLSFLSASSQSSLNLHLPVAQRNKMPAGYVAPFSNPLSSIPVGQRHLHPSGIVWEGERSRDRNWEFQHLLKLGLEHC